MASNSFGTLFRVTTWGESHGPSIGCVIDGCPAGLALDQVDIQRCLDLRRPGRNALVSPRKEPDLVEIHSGIFEGKTTGAPISLLIRNCNQDSKDYEASKEVLRPGHATYTYMKKYGVFDYRGGGRASARETACRVAAGAVAEKLLRRKGISIVAYIKSIGSIEASIEIPPTQIEVEKDAIFCPDKSASIAMQQLLDTLIQEGDSIGGCVEVRVDGLCVGLGDPIYEKLDAKLAYAMLSIPASKGFEIGDANAHCTQGSLYSDSFIKKEHGIELATNHAGGLLGGISTGEPLIFRVFFKPTASIKKALHSVSISGENVEYKQSDSARHDPCVAIRAVPVCCAMAQLVIADALLLCAIHVLEGEKNEEILYSL